MTPTQLKMTIAAGAKTAADAAQIKRRGYIIGLSVGDVYVIKKDGRRVKVPKGYNPGPVRGGAA